MAPGAEDQVKPDAQKQQPGPYFGRFASGKWYCDCNRMAHCRTVVNGGPNQGKRFWICPKPQRSGEQCPFFIFVDEEATAIEWLEKHAPQPTPVTPTRGREAINEPLTPGTSANKPSRGVETPFTVMANRKRKSKEDQNEGKRDLENRDLDGGEIMVADGSSDENPSGVAAKKARLSTPPRSNEHKSPAPAATLPSPQTDEKAAQDDFTSEIETRRSMASSPTPAGRRGQKSPRNAKPPDLATTILAMLRSDSVMLKGTTATRIRHEIGLQTDSFHAKERRYEKTIADLAERINDLETTLGHLTEGLGVDDAIELSD